jgi:lipopolysaccharide export system ATP-binding protein
MTAVLEAHGFGKRYRRRTWALRNVDLTVPEGSITALVGPNGSGKSTLIRGWIGFERATEGRLVTGGVDPQRDRKGAVERVGYVPQSPSLYRDLTIADHIALAGTLRDGFDGPMAAGYVERLSIPLRAKAGELSGGEQAQVGLSLALATRARIFLLDEPLAGIDPIAVGDIRDLVAHLKDRGIGVLITDHNVRDTLQIVDRAYILHEGHVLMEGAPDEIVADAEVRRVYLGERFSL